MRLLALASKTTDTAPPANASLGRPSCRVRVPAAIWDEMRGWLLAADQERFAYLLGRACVITDSAADPSVDIWVRRAVPVPERALAVQSRVRVEVDPQFSAAILRACWEGGLSLVDVHTHPFADTAVGFSGHDRENMARTHAEFLSIIPSAPPAVAASLVLGRRSAAGSWLVPGTSRLEPLHSLHVIGDHDTTIPLCVN